MSRWRLAWIEVTSTVNALWFAVLVLSKGLWGFARGQGFIASCREEARRIEEWLDYREAEADKKLAQSNERLAEATRKNAESQVALEAAETRLAGAKKKLDEQKRKYDQ